MSMTDSERDPLEMLMDEYAQQCRAGQAPSISEFAGQHPEWSAQLRELLPTVARMEKAKAAKRSSEIVQASRLKLERLGDYRIVREIGRGGMGIVFEAEQESLHRRVALKVLPQHSQLDPRRLERARREAKAAARLHHTNIVAIFGVGEQDGLHYIVMQYIEGHGLHELLGQWKRDSILSKLPPTQAEGFGTQRVLTFDATPSTQSSGNLAAASSAPLSGSQTNIVPLPKPNRDRWQKIAHIGEQIASALDYAHRQGVLHRDVKPANLLLDKQDNAWIVDFGLAKLTDAPEGFTSDGQVLGTLQYVAPEVLDGKGDARSDIYGLGLTLYELATLQSPFVESSPASMLKKIREHQPARPRKINPAVPADLETIILKAIRPEVKDRYPTAGDMAEDLQRFLSDQPILARRMSLAEKSWRWCRKNKAIATLAAALAVTFVAGFAGVTWKWRDAEDQRIQTELAKLQAEDNLQLSLSTLDGLLDQVDVAIPGVWGQEDRPRRFDPSDRVKRSAALLREVLDFYEQLQKRNQTNPQLQEKAARAFNRASQLEHLLGHSDEEDKAYQQSVTLWKGLLESSPSSETYRLELAKTYLPDAPGGIGETKVASQRLHWADEILLDLVKENPRDRSYAALLARAKKELGDLAVRQGQHEEALDDYEAAAQLLKSLVDEEPGDTGQFINWVGVQHERAKLLTKSDPSLARTILSQTLTLLDSAPNANRQRMFSVDVATMHRDFAALLRDSGDVERADAEQRRADELARQVPPFRRNPGSRPPGP
jgi:serine/threonine protein kinase